ncbi:intermembrane transport protein PqiB [Salinisphaera sp. T31B1]|uniref:intermembrane transport protein PqiB n=1 Tax=Salinisphaera sp. T31B1 TaxID=727963 RepID=UPI003341BA9B
MTDDADNQPTREGTDTAHQAVISRPRRWRISPVWLIPLGAALIGAWLIYQNVISKGPQITLSVDTAEGMEAGSTLVKVRSVEVGHVTDVHLADDYQGAVVTVQMDPDTGPLLVDDSRFWIVKPRVGRQGISGLGTILSGAYIQLQPGSSDTEKRRFTVRDSAPAISTDEPGLSLQLTSNNDNSLAVGDPIIYQGQTVGQIESADFNVDAKRMDYHIFIREPFSTLVTHTTQFWLRSGVDFHLGSDGVDVQLGSIQSVLAGGVTFGTPDDVTPGSQASNGDRYELYATRNAATQDRYDHKIEYVILLDDSVRGLSAGAPVEYRGLRIGTVEEVPYFREDFDFKRFSNFKIPVLVAIEPQRPANAWADWTDRQWRDNLQKFFNNGLRATIKSGNLLTGSTFIDTQFEKNATYQASTIGQYPVFPSVPSSITSIQQQLSSLMDRLNAIDVRPIVDDLKHTLDTTNATLDEMHTATQSINRLLSDSDTRALPGEVRQSLAEMQNTLQSFQQGAPAYREFNRTMDRLNRVLDDAAPLTRTLRNAPNALIFGPPDGDDPIPKAAR